MRPKVCSRNKVCLLPLLRRYKQPLIVWWYGGILKNHDAETIPKVSVFFRELNDKGNYGNFIRIPVGIMELALLRIGSIWQEGAYKSEVALQENEFAVDFSRDEWEYVSPSQGLLNGEQALINQADYPLFHPNDRNWLIKFLLPGGKNLLIPCIEFYSRFYGRSEEVKRVLTVYPWELARKKLYAPDQYQSSDKWAVKLAMRMYNEDVIILAHLLYDDFARNAAKHIYSQAEAQFKNSNDHSFVQVGPWFEGPAQLAVKGHWINESRTFLALQILGGSEPQGVPILRDRENTNKVVKTAEGVDVETAWPGTPRRGLKKLPEIVDLTDDKEPDHGSAMVEVEGSAFIVMGERRVVTDVMREQAKSKAGERRAGENPKAFSGGEPYGKDKDVGFASIHSPSFMESQGTLRDIWSALLDLQHKLPDIIRKVEWFTFDGGFNADMEPLLIKLAPFDDEEKAELKHNGQAETINWLYFNTARKIPRGVLAIRTMAEGTPVYFIEIQRRPRKKKPKEGETINGGEAFSGLVFMLDNHAQFERRLKKLLSEIRLDRGVFKKFTEIRNGRAATFKHVFDKDEKVAPGTAAVTNALRKMGIRIKSEKLKKPGSSRALKRIVPRDS